MAGGSVIFSLLHDFPYSRWWWNRIKLRQNLNWFGQNDFRSSSPNLSFIRRTNDIETDLIAPINYIPMSPDPLEGLSGEEISDWKLRKTFKLFDEPIVCHDPFD